MKKQILLLFLLAASVLSVSAQKTNSVINLDWNLNETEEQIIITYDLVKDGTRRYFDVLVKVNIEGNEFIPKALSGDIGNYIKSGNKKKIIWNVFNDVTELSGELEILVVAQSIESTVKTDTKKPKTKKEKSKVSVYAGLGGVLLVGGGLAGLGGKQMLDAKKLYDDVYAANTDPNAVIYNEYSQSRTEFFSDVNSDYRRGSVLAIGGAAVLIGGGLIVMNRMRQLNKLKKKNITLNPYYHVSPNAVTTKSSVNGELGLGLKYSF